MKKHKVMVVHHYNHHERTAAAGLSRLFPDSAGAASRLLLCELIAMNKQGNYNLFQLINSLYEYRSVILTTNKGFTAWGEFFVDENVAVPIIDRLIHHSKIFMLGGESYRLKQKTSA